MTKGDNVLIHYPTLNKLATFLEYVNNTYLFQDHSGIFGVTEKYKKENNVQFEVIED